MMHVGKAAVFALAAGLLFLAYSSHLVMAGTLPNITGAWTAHGTFSNPRTLDTDWANGMYWTRAPGSSTPAASEPTPQPTPTPARLNVKVDIEHNGSPIYVYDAQLRNGAVGRTYSQCVSFRNISNKVATNVDFSFVVKGHYGKVWADFGDVDRGTFAPPVNIDDHCWKGPLWPDRVVRLMSHQEIRVKQVTFADATTWQPGLPFTRKYANDGTLPANP